ncbi:TPA: phage tail protein [Salmonella enterica subsp. enterica serovar Concord]|nr:phage tail protein [Salmonella enterica subsp. enterica serovar Concord]
MTDFNNLFDAALSRADNAIQGVMGKPVTVRSAGREYTISAVYDDPENVGYPTGGIRIEGSSPSIFVRSADVAGLSRLDVVVAGGVSFWVDRIGPDDCGSRHIWLGTGKPPTDNRYRG